MKKIKITIEISPFVLLRLIALSDLSKSMDSKIELILSSYIIKKEDEAQRNR